MIGGKRMIEIQLWVVSAIAFGSFTLGAGFALFVALRTIDKTFGK